MVYITDHTVPRSTGNFQPWAPVHVEIVGRGVVDRNDSAVAGRMVL